MRARGIVLILVLAVLAPSVAAAEEMVTFVDGRFLKVESHLVGQAAVRLVFGERGTIVVPADRVESIERNGRVVYRAPAPRAAGAEQASVPAAGDFRSTRDHELYSRGPKAGDRPAPGPLLASNGEPAASARR